MGTRGDRRGVAARRRALIRIALGAGVLLVLSSASASADQRGAASDRIDSSRGFSGFPAIYYTDETGIAGGGYLVYSRQLAKDALSSSLASFLVYTQKQQVLAGAALEYYEEAYNFTAAVIARRYPNTFYGLGRDSREVDAEEYTDRGFEMSMSPQRRLRPGFYAGPLLVYEKHRLSGVAPDGLLAAALGRDESSYRIAGAGGMLTRDTRDNSVYPTRGSYHTAFWVWFGEAIGSDRGFTSAEINLRRYLPVSPRQTVALQCLWAAVGDGAPLLSYPVLGDGNLRGFASRYTDRTLAVLHAEYRVRLGRRWGLAGFAGLGDVAPRPRRLSLREASFGGGVGLRYLLVPQTGLNLRLDLGLGTGGNSSLAIIPREAF